MSISSIMSTLNANINNVSELPTIRDNARSALYEIQGDLHPLIAQAPFEERTGFLGNRNSESISAAVTQIGIAINSLGSHQKDVVASTRDAANALSTADSYLSHIQGVVGGPLPR